MSAITDNLALLFSSTERRKGESSAEERAVQLSSSSDTFITAFVRTSSPGRVTLSASEVAIGAITAKCTCTKKAQLCRHVWAVLLKLEEQNHDFLLGKDSISLANEEDEDDATVYRSGSDTREKQIAYKEKQKALAKEYRKQRNEKQKEIRKQHRKNPGYVSADAEATSAQPSGGRKARTPAFTYPSHVEEARRYFQTNGYEMKQPFELAEILEAKKQLSRVFHPDKGGSHDEILELNRNFQILSDYLKS